MAFVCTTSGGGFRVEGFEAGRKGRFIVSIGYDPAISMVYTATVAIQPIPGATELAFYVSAVNEITDEEETFWSGRDTSFIRLPSDRAVVLGSICVALEEALAAIQPEELVWTTHDEALPDKALIKYDRVREVVEAHGMAVLAESLPGGHWHWHAERSASRFVT